MTPASPPRHLLIVAPQCKALSHLSGLEDVAHSLQSTLEDPWVGGCESPQGLSRRLVGNVKRAVIDEAVRAAALQAGAAGAVLVLVILGHGMILGTEPGLSLMASDSIPDQSMTVVDVNDLLIKAASSPGVPEVIALVDTCHSGAATPNLTALNWGVRQGATRISLLTSVGVNDLAFDLKFSRALTSVLQDGIQGAGQYLSLQTVHNRMKTAHDVDGQLTLYDGISHDPPNWLSRNAQHDHTGGLLLGPIGEEELRSALAPLDKEDSVAKISDPTDLDRLHHELLKIREGSDNSVDAEGALRVIRGLREAYHTKELLDSWPGEKTLTSTRLRHAVRAAAGRAVQELEGSGTHLLRDCVEVLRLRAPRVHQSRTEPLATFVASLAAEDCLPPHAKALKNWADSVCAVTELNDAFEKIKEHEKQSRLRLVVSLDAALADDWPETLRAWLLDHGEPVDHDKFPCKPTQSGVERALRSVLKWAHIRGRKRGESVHRVEIAAPAPLLVRWRPEETPIGEFLGVNHDIVLRWSDRICPPEHLDLINEIARKHLEKMQKDSTHGAPVSWLGLQHTSQTGELVEQLEHGSYKPALALNHRPSSLEKLLEQLLAHRPIVLWSEDEGVLPPETREAVERYWHRLPDEFSNAYRNSWQDSTEQVAAAEYGRNLARLRSVWDDLEWLDFCDWFEMPSIDSEEVA
ncbi:vWA-MoxR associated conflict system protein [Streptomyces sp. DB-54]